MGAANFEEIRVRYRVNFVGHIHQHLRFKRPDALTDRDLQTLFNQIHPAMKDKAGQPPLCLPEHVTRGASAAIGRRYRLGG